MKNQKQAVRVSSRVLFYLSLQVSIMNHLSAWIAKQEDTERDCEALGGIVHDTKIPIAVDAMIRIIGTQDTSYLPCKNLQRDETRQKIPSTLVIVCDATHKFWSQHARMTNFRLLGSIERRIVINEDFPAVCVLHIDEYRRAMQKVYHKTYGCSNALPTLLYCMWWRVIVHVERVQSEVTQLILLEAQSRWVIVDGPIAPTGLWNLLIWVRAGWARNPARRQELIERFVHPPMVNTVNAVKVKVNPSPGEPQTHSHTVQCPAQRRHGPSPKQCRLRDGLARGDSPAASKDWRYSA